MTTFKYKYHNRMTTHYYIKDQSNDLKIWADFRVPEVFHISYNTGTRAFSDMSALTLRRCAPPDIVHTYQAMHLCLCHNYYLYELINKPQVM